MATIPLHQHTLWPMLFDARYAASANNPVSRNWGLDLDSTDTVCVPKQHAVFTFALKHCVSQITWYPASNLVSVDGRLYSVFFEHNHLLGSYAWLSTVNETVSEEYLTVENTPLTYIVSDGILTINGMYIHRRTGQRHIIYQMRRNAPGGSMAFERVQSRSRDSLPSTECTYALEQPDSDPPALVEKNA
jgi:hypothetical protein